MKEITISSVILPDCDPNHLTPAKKIQIEEI